MKPGFFRLAGTLLLLVAIATIGCGKKGHDIVGTWIPKGQVSGGIEMYMDLKPDGTWSQSINDTKTVASAAGTYTSDKYSLNLTEAQTAVGSKVKKSAKNWKYSYKIVWVSDDEVQLTPNDAGKSFGSVTYSRKK
jgi:hypothetical protein